MSQRGRAGGGLDPSYQLRVRRTLQIAGVWFAVLAAQTGLALYLMADLSRYQRMETKVLDFFTRSKQQQQQQQQQPGESETEDT